MDTIQFEFLYRQCFDDDNNIKVCGREMCQRLLSFLDDPRYGNIETGELNIDEIVALYKSVFGEQEIK